MAGKIATYKDMKTVMERVLHRLQVLSGDVVTADPSLESWHDVARNASHNLRHLADMIDQCRQGDCEHPIVFPSVAECLGEHV